MRWNHLSDDDRDATPALFGTDVVTHTPDTPEFRGVTFHEVRARSLINSVPAASRMPFDWTVNPYRGCSHACVYCFARNTHRYLDLDTGTGFDSQIVVKVNAPELLRRELAGGDWQGRHIAMGTNVDCYQRAEGRYVLMPGIIRALRDHAVPFSILTKGTLILRDLDLLAEAAERTEVGVSVSVGSTDRALWRTVEPGTPAPERRLEVVRALAQRNIPCGVLMAPVIPFLSDSADQLRHTVRAIAEAGAASITPLALHLRPGAREWFLDWLGEHHPELWPRYRALYGDQAYAPRWYQRRISGRVRDLAAEYGIGRTAAGNQRNSGNHRKVQPQARADLSDHSGGASNASEGAENGTQLTLI